MFFEGIILVLAGFCGFYFGDVKNVGEEDLNKASQWLQSWTRVPTIGAGWNARLACSGLFVSERHWAGIQNNELSGINSLFFCSPIWRSGSDCLSYWAGRKRLRGIWIP